MAKLNLALDPGFVDGVHEDGHHLDIPWSALRPDADLFAAIASHLTVRLVLAIGFLLI